MTPEKTPTIKSRAEEIEIINRKIFLVEKILKEQEEKKIQEEARKHNQEIRVQQENPKPLLHPKESTISLNVPEKVLDRKKQELFEKAKRYISKISGRMSRKAKLLAMIAGTGVISYSAARESDTINNAIHEYVNDDLANIIRLPMDIAPEVIWNGVQKKLKIGDYGESPESGDILKSEEENGSSASVPVAETKKEIVKDVWIGKSIQRWHGLEVRPYIINMNADSGYTFTTYRNLDALNNKELLKTIEADGIIGGLPGIFAPHVKDPENGDDSTELFLVMNDVGKLSLHYGSMVAEGEKTLKINSRYSVTNFDEIDTVTENGTLMIHVQIDSNLNTAVLRGRDGKDLGIGLTSTWQKKDYIPLEEARAYGQSRGGMVFIVSTDLKDQYIVGGSFKNMWDVYTKLREYHPEREYLLIKNDYGSYANSLFSPNGIITPKDQRTSSARNSYGTMDMLVLKRQ